MADDRIETAAALYEAWNEGGLAEVSERYWAADIEWRDDPAVPDAGAYRGRREVREHIAERVDLLGEFDIDVERLVACGDNRVLAVYVFRGQGGVSAAPYALRIAQMLTIEDGRVTLVQDMLDAEQALAEATSAAEADG